jgi:hypothetical protein
MSDDTVKILSRTYGGMTGGDRQAIADIFDEFEAQRKPTNEDGTESLDGNNDYIKDLSQSLVKIDELEIKLGLAFSALSILDMAHKTGRDDTLSRAIKLCAYTLIMIKGTQE